MKEIFRSVQWRRGVVVPIAALMLPLACSGNARHSDGTGGSAAFDGSAMSATSGAAGDALTAVPQNLSNTLLEGEVAGGLTLIAFTLTQGAAGPELYAAVRNDGLTPACEAGMTTYFIDQAGALVTTASSVLQSGRFYRLGSGELISCVDPGQIAMTGSTDLPRDIVIAELGSLEHAFPAFTVDGIAPVDALSASDVQIVRTALGSAYTGVLDNELDVAASRPSVTIFPLNRVGRPLGIATSGSAAALAPRGSWMFQTSVVDDLGVDYAVYPSFSE